MLRAILTAGIVCLIADSASAQYPTQPFPGSTGTYNYGGYGYGTPYGPTINTQNFMPNIFNPQNQPLSPYLNLFRGNTGVNYFFGVRPGTLGMGNRNFGGAPFMAFGGNRMLFFPQLASAPEPLAAEEGPGSQTVLPPAGHPVVFSNTMGFYPSPFGQAGSGRAGLAGLGAMSRSGPRK